MEIVASFKTNVQRKAFYAQATPKELAAKKRKEIIKKAELEKIAPFKSDAQRRWMFAAEDRGEVPKGTADRWAKHTKNIKKLPERIKKANMDYVKNFYKIAKKLLNSKENPLIKPEEKIKLEIDLAKQKKFKGLSPSEKRTQDIKSKNNSFSRNAQSFKH
jgi:hypothetical protein